MTRWTRYGPHARRIPDNYPWPGIPPHMIPTQSLDGMYGEGRDSHYHRPVETSPIPATADGLLAAIDAER